MKVFEEWWSETLCSNDEKLKTIAKISWKEALMWVRNKCCGVRSEDLEKLNEEICKELD